MVAMKKIIGSFFLILGLIQGAYADCDEAYKKCITSCDSVKSISNLENGRLVKSSATDFPSKCEDSCRRGRRYCEDESNRSEGCYEFKRACRNECPSTVFNYRSGNFMLLTDANSKCEDACSFGYRNCE